MRAIIIDDKDSKALLDAISLAKFQDVAGREFGLAHVTDHDRKFIIDAMHRRFHYVVTRWLQDQGASGLQ